MTGPKPRVFPFLILPLVFDIITIDLSDSPYITPVFTLLVGFSRVPYTIQEHLLYQSPLWRTKCLSKPWGNKLALPDVNEDIGHSLVHYLYTGDYQTLKPQIISVKTPDELNNPSATSKEPEAHGLREYRRSVRLYCVARTYGLEGLGSLSVYHMENPQDKISIWNILDIAGEAYGTLPDHEEWFTEYLRRKLEAALRVDRSLLKRQDFLGRIGMVKKFDQALMKSIAEIYTGRTGPGDRADGTDKEPASEDETSISAHRGEPVEVEPATWVYDTPTVEAEPKISIYDIPAVKAKPIRVSRVHNKPAMKVEPLQTFRVYDEPAEESVPIPVVPDFSDCFFDPREKKGRKHVI